MSASDLKINLKHLNSAEFSMCNLPINLLWFQEIWEDICTLYMSITQGPHSQILIMGGPTEVHILYKKKSQLQNLSTQKNHYFFLAYPKKSFSPFFATQKNPSVFFRNPKTSWHHSQSQKIHFWPKFQTQKNNSDPPSLKYVSGAPGVYNFWCNSKIVARQTVL